MTSRKRRGEDPRRRPLRAAAGAALCSALALGAAPAGAPGAPSPAAPAPPAGMAEAAETAKRALVETHGEGERDRAERGVEQVQSAWRADDGDARAFAEFVAAEFVPRGQPLDDLFARFEFALERIGGYFVSLSRDLRWHVDVEAGPMLPIDLRLAAFEPAAHLADDSFATKLAFVALLNFPLTTLEGRLEQGAAGHGASGPRRAWRSASPPASRPR